ncbi:MAG: biliverdin-producing heme oxygenase [Flavipsychrobacter sp.]|nr:biliverdin-producing heme oxygenase [Flavipsychrobacter sp.]
MQLNNTAPQGSVAGDAFIRTLRERTGPAHRQLEALPLSRAIVDPAVTKAQYTRYLQLMADVVADVEEHLFPLLAGTIPDIDERRKLAFITADLALLGAGWERTSPVTGATGTMGLAEAMGVMYVIEGSTLGGRVIVKNIESALGYQEKSGAAYFSGYGTRTGPLWKSFLECFTAFAAGAEEGAVLKGADHAFTTIYKQLSISI